MVVLLQVIMVVFFPFKNTTTSMRKEKKNTVDIEVWLPRLSVSNSNNSFSYIFFPPFSYSCSSLSLSTVHFFFSQNYTLPLLEAIFYGVRTTSHIGTIISTISKNHHPQQKPTPSLFFILFLFGTTN